VRSSARPLLAPATATRSRSERPLIDPLNRNLIANVCKATYQVAEQNLILRVAQAYFSVLTAEANLEAQQTSLEAISRQLDQANRRFAVGLVPITDVEDAKAARDSAAAAVIAAKRTLATTEDQLQEITGQKYDVQAETDYSGSRYDYIVSIVQLRLAAGNLSAHESWWMRAAPATTDSGASHEAPSGRRGSYGGLDQNFHNPGASYSRLRGHPQRTAAGGRGSTRAWR
jgi:hypothetical protein